MRIELDNLEKGSKFARVYQPGELSLDEHDPQLVAPAEVHGRVRKRDAGVELLGHLSATVEAPCARCLRPVELPIEADFSERFVPAVTWRSEEHHELCEEDLNLAVFSGDSIELDDLVREEILLALPAQVVCREDCKGLCPDCGVDRNLSECHCETRQLDSRWQALKDLRF